jgi:hypothetical protein
LECFENKQLLKKPTVIYDNKLFEKS